MILNFALLDTCFREGRQPQSVSKRLPGWARTKIISPRHISDVRVRLMPDNEDIT